MRSEAVLLLWKCCLNEQYALSALTNKSRQIQSDLTTSTSLLTVSLMILLRVQLLDRDAEEKASAGRWQVEVAQHGRGIASRLSALRIYSTRETGIILNAD